MDRKENNEPQDESGLTTPTCLVRPTSAGDHQVGDDTDYESGMSESSKSVQDTKDACSSPESGSVSENLPRRRLSDAGPVLDEESWKNCHESCRRLQARRVPPLPSGKDFKGLCMLVESVLKAMVSFQRVAVDKIKPTDPNLFTLYASQSMALDLSMELLEAIERHFIIWNTTSKDAGWDGEDDVQGEDNDTDDMMIIISLMERNRRLSDQRSEPTLGGIEDDSKAEPKANPDEDSLAQKTRRALADMNQWFSSDSSFTQKRVLPKFSKTKNDMQRRALAPETSDGPLGAASSLEKHESDTSSDEGSSSRSFGRRYTSAAGGVPSSGSSNSGEDAADWKQKAFEAEQRAREAELKAQKAERRARKEQQLREASERSAEMAERRAQEEQRLREDQEWQLEQQRPTFQHSRHGSVDSMSQGRQSEEGTRVSSPAFAQPWDQEVGIPLSSPSNWSRFSDKSHRSRGLTGRALSPSFLEQHLQAGIEAWQYAVYIWCEMHYRLMMFLFTRRRFFSRLPSLRDIDSESWKPEAVTEQDFPEMAFFHLLRLLVFCVSVVTFTACVAERQIWLQANAETRGYLVRHVRKEIPRLFLGVDLLLAKRGCQTAAMMVLQLPDAWLPQGVIFLRWVLVDNWAIQWCSSKLARGWRTPRVRSRPPPTPSPESASGSGPAAGRRRWVYKI